MRNSTLNNNYPISKGNASSFIGARCRLYLHDTLGLQIHIVILFPIWTSEEENVQGGEARDGESGVFSEIAIQVSCFVN